MNFFFINHNRHNFSSFRSINEWIRINFDPKSIIDCFSFFLVKHVIFTYFSVLSFVFVISSFNTILFILISQLCTVCFLFLIIVWYLFDSDLKINFDQVQIQSMTFALSTFQIQKYVYFGGLSIFIFVGIYLLCRFMLLTWVLWVCSQFHHFCF